MPTESTFTELLLRWEELQGQGQDITPEELCQKCPEHLEELRRQIDRLRAVDRHLQLTTYEGVERSLQSTVLPGDTDTDKSVQPFAVDPAAGSGRYTIVRHHARGGLGEVCIAQDTELNRQIALKRIQPRHAHDADSKRRFLVEAKITARLEHPGVVPVYGLVTDADGQPSYAMRFIEGESLADGIKAFHGASKGRQTPVDSSNEIAQDLTPKQKGANTPSSPAFDSLAFRQLLQRFIAVCNTIAYAHSRGVIHRDLKPANVMLGKFGETLVVDWGLAKTIGTAESTSGGLAADRPTDADAEGTQQGQAIGTPAYMSPEQAAGRWDIVGGASDIYSLGATLYVLLTGHALFDETDVVQVLERVACGRFPRPRERCRDVPRALEAIALKALSRRPDERYATAEQLGKEVERWLADEPVAVLCESAFARARRWARRHRNVAASAALALLILLLASGAEFYRWQATAYEKQQIRREQVLRVHFAAEAQEQSGLAALRASRWGDAVTAFQKALESLGQEAESVALRTRLAERLNRAQRLHGYRQFERRMAESVVFNAQEETLHSLEEALAALGVAIAPGWETKLPVHDLSPRQALLLRADVHGRLLMLGAIRSREGFMNVLKPEAARQGWRKALDALTAAQAYERTVNGSATEFFCRMMLGQLPQSERFEPRESADNVVDHMFLGMMHVWLAQAADDGITVFVKSFFRTPLLDYATPLARAEWHFRAAVATYPDYPWTYALLADCYLRAHKYAEAELTARAQIALTPDEPMAYRLLASALLRRNHATRLRAERNHAARAAVESAALRQQALEAADKMVDAGGGRWLDYYMRGSLRLAAEANVDAIADLDLAWTKVQTEAPNHPGLAEIQRRLGDATANLGRHAQAVQHYTHALRIFPDGIELYKGGKAILYWELAQAHAMLGADADAEAIAVARQAIRLRPKDFMVHLWLIRHCDATRRHAEADQLRELLPPNYRLREGLERNYIWLLLWSQPHF